MMGKVRRYGPGCIGGLLLAGLVSWVFYWGWCWGWWGLGNRFLQYFFQCQCPAASEEARYPERIDVLFPACDEPGSVRISPSGRYWQIALEDNWYFYDYATQHLRPDFLPGNAYFLTDEYIMTIAPSNSLDFKDRKHYLYNVSGNKLLQFNLTQVSNDLSLDTTTVAAFRAASNVYVFQGLAVALATDPLQHPAENYVLGDPDNRSLTSKQMAEILEQYGIKHETPVSGRVSHNGLMQSDDVRGIILIENGKILASNYDPYDDLYCELKAGLWVYQDRGTIMSRGRLYLSGCATGRPMEINAGEVPQPLLLLKVPAEYLDPQQQQAELARQAQEAANKQQAVVTFWVVITVAGVTATAAIALSTRGPFRPVKGEPASPRR